MLHCSINVVTEVEHLLYHGATMLQMVRVAHGYAIKQAGTVDG